MVIFEGHDEFLGLLPRTILIQHYVSLQILLKQLVVHANFWLLHLLFCKKKYIYIYKFVFFSSRLIAETQKDLPKREKKKPWCEVVPSFTGTTTEESETLDNIQTDYGFQHDYESDTESIKFETCSFVTQFNLEHEDELDESSSLQMDGIEAERGKGRLKWNYSLLPRII